MSQASDAVAEFATTVAFTDGAWEIVAALSRDGLSRNDDGAAEFVAVATFTERPLSHLTVPPITQFYHLPPDNPLLPFLRCPQRHPASRVRHYILP